jgi:hypothetical protein
MVLCALRISVGSFSLFSVILWRIIFYPSSMYPYLLSFLNLLSSGPPPLLTSLSSLQYL